MNFKNSLVIDGKDSNDYSNLLNKYKNCTSIKTLDTGYGQALIDGINQIETKFFCIINADVSMNPKDISKMLELSKDFSFLGKLLFRLNISDILYAYVAAYTWNTYKYNHQRN